MGLGRNLLGLLLSLTPTVVGCGDAVVGEQGCFGKGVKCNGARYANENESLPELEPTDIVATRTVSAIVQEGTSGAYGMLKSDGRGTTWALTNDTLLRLDAKGHTSKFDLTVDSDKASRSDHGNEMLSLDGLGLPVVAFSEGAIMQLSSKGELEQSMLTGVPLFFDGTNVYWIVSDRHGGYFAHTSEGLLGFDKQGELRFRQVHFVPTGFDGAAGDFGGLTPGGERQVAVASDGAVATLLNDGVVYWLVCLELDGNTRWARQVDLTEGISRALTVDHDDNFILALSGTDTIKVERISAAGKYLEGFRAERLGYPSATVSALAVDPAGTIIVGTRSGSREEVQSTVCTFNRKLSECVAVERKGESVLIEDLAAPAPGVVVITGDAPLTRVEL